MSVKIEAGKYYRTRDGRKVGPMEPNTDNDPAYYGRWKAPAESWMGFAPFWYDCGLFWPGKETEKDLIAELIDTPDLTTLTAPVGLLDEVYGPGTKAALIEHGGPYEYWDGDRWREAMSCKDAAFCVHRVKPTPPAPKVETVKLTGFFKPSGSWIFNNRDSSSDTHAITLTIIDGEVQPTAEVTKL